MSESKLRVIIADDHASIRQALKILLHLETDIEVVAEASNGEEVILLAREFHPSEIVMDISMPEKNGIDATREILSELPEIRVLIISSRSEQDAINEAFSSGALGYISKGDSLLAVPFALRELHRGGSFISPGAARFRR